jgi:hypothetical protein
VIAREVYRQDAAITRPSAMSRKAASMTQSTRRMTSHIRHKKRGAASGTIERCARIMQRSAHHPFLAPSKQ